MGKRNGRRVLFFAVGTFLLLTTAFLSSAKAEENAEEEYLPFTGPLPLRNDNPLYLALFSAVLPDQARTTAPRRWSLEAGHLGSNNVIEQHNVTESDFVLLDMELQRFELDLRYGLQEKLELRATLPYLFMGGGYMDDFILSFEETFGFTTPGARESRGENEFRYLFRVNGQNLIDESDTTIQGLGDIPIQLKYQFRDEQGGLLPDVAVRGILKLPTATESILGNGHVGGGIGLLAEQPIGKRILLIGNLDITSVRPTRRLKSLNLDDTMVSGLLGFEHRLTRRLSWKGYTLGATNPYPTFHEDMSALNRPPMGVGIGAAYRFKRATVKLNVVENFFSAWPDFAWGISVQTDL